MTFAEITSYLNLGFAVRRESYNPSLIIFKSISVSADDASEIAILPSNIKNLLIKYKAGIDYESLYFIYDFKDGVCTPCMFDGEDIDAVDWEVIDDNYNPYE